MEETGLLAGQVAVVTGGGSGIGKAIATTYADAGCAVVVAGRTRSRVDTVASTVEAAGGTAVAASADVTREEDVRRLFADTVARFGRVDLLVASAGAFDGAPAHELSLDAWERVLSVNVTGVFLSAREALRVMKDQGHGRIIVMGSIAGRRARTQSAAYAASKHAVWGLTQALAIDAREYGVAVSCLQPGNTEVERRAETHTLTGQSEHEEPVMPVDDVARTALLMATVSPGTNLLEAVVLPVTQRYLGRG